MKKFRIEDLTLREKIGQTVIARAQLLKDVENIEAHLKENPYGGIWLQGNRMLEFDNMSDEQNGNVDEDYTRKYVQWINKLNSCLTIPLLTGMDAESGGKQAFPELTRTTTATGLAATNSEELAFETGACVAAEVLSAGANWIWGPVLDIVCNYNTSNSNRTFSNRPEISIKLANAQIAGIQSQGVAATSKHFPGTGETEHRDPHFVATLITDTLEQWESKQAKIFKATIDSGVYSMMIGHTAFPAIDDAQPINNVYIPATLSYKIITELLKEKMNFQGVVVTDAIGMRALSSIYNEPKKLYVELLKAGNDMILGPVSLDYIDAVEEAVLAGEIPESRIDDACTKVISMKEKLKIGLETYQGGIPRTAEIVNRMNNLNKTVAENAITLMCNHNKLVPVNSNDVKKVAIIYIGHSDTVYEELDVMVKSFERRGAIVHLQHGLKAGDCEKIARENDLIVYVNYIGPHCPFGPASYFGSELLSFLYVMEYGKEKSLCVSLGSPFIYYDFFPTADVFINAYGYNKDMQEAVVAGLFGEIPFKGKSPFPLKPFEFKVDLYNEK